MHVGSGMRHNLEHKSARKRRALSADEVMAPNQVKKMKNLLGMLSCFEIEQDVNRKLRNRLWHVSSAQWNAHKKRRVVLERASGYRGQRSRLYRKAKEQLLHSFTYNYRGPQGSQGRFPQAVDPAHQRRGPRRGHHLQPLHPGPAPGPASSSTRRALGRAGRLRSGDLQGPSSAEAKNALPADVNAPVEA